MKVRFLLASNGKLLNTYKQNLSLRWTFTDVEMRVLDWNVGDACSRPHYTMIILSQPVSHLTTLTRVKILLYNHADTAGVCTWTCVGVPLRQKCYSWTISAGALCSLSWWEHAMTYSPHFLVDGCLSQHNFVMPTWTWYRPRLFWM